MAGKKIHDNETKTHLIQCAKKEFMDKGFAGASLRGICQKAGVTTGALYFFFQDKDDLFCEVVGNFMDRLNEILREHFSFEVREMESGKAKEHDDSSDFEALADAGKYPLMITQVYSKFVASDVKLALMDVLDDETPVWFLRNLGLPDEECRTVPLYELDRQENIDHLTSVFVPEYKEKVSVMDVRPLTEVMATLRSPGGCPWDMEQTHSSIRKSLIEEVYELLEAIDNMDYENMKEELGDVLLQVVFHARLAEEEGAFTMQDVVDEIVNKLIRRHPHVYGTIEVGSSDEVLQNWDAIKQTEKKERTHVLDGVTKGQPALMRAYKLNSKAAKAGFDWPDNDGVWNKVLEEAAELKEAVAFKNREEQEHELGDLLFSIAAYAKHIGLEPETALNAANNRFVKRFSYVESCVEESGRDWKDFTLAELDAFWNKAKLIEIKDCEKK